mmetsp:Transcript_19726/g.45404  ORF Transcript_19726/g.45404 Transcript_19726/m.45404 type:complete len:232 (+) Transcript_19726:709-1404(+)
MHSQPHGPRERRCNWEQPRRRANAPKAEPRAPAAPPAAPAAAAAPSPLHAEPTALDRAQLAAGRAVRPRSSPLRRTASPLRARADTPASASRCAGSTTRSGQLAAGWRARSARRRCSRPASWARWTWARRATARLAPSERRTSPPRCARRARRASGREVRPKAAPPPPATLGWLVSALLPSAPIDLADGSRAPSSRSQRAHTLSPRALRSAPSQPRLAARELWRPFGAALL